MNIAQAVQPTIDYWNKIDKIKARIERAEKQIKKAGKKFNGWKETIFTPIAEELLKYFPDYTYELMGPFGFCNEVAIHFKKKGIEEDPYEVKEGVLSISFTFSIGENNIPRICIRDYSEKNEEFPEGSIGAMNGMNYKSIPLEPTFEVKNLIKYVR